MLTLITIHNACVDVWRRDLFAASAAKCLSMLPVHLEQFAADTFSREQTLHVPSGASSHRFTLATFCLVLLSTA